MARRRQAPATLSKFIAIGIPLLTFIAGSMINGFNLANSVAKKEDVEKSFKLSTDYTDRLMREVLKSANENTEAKTQAVMLKLEEMKTDVKSTESALTAEVRGLSKNIEDLKYEIQIKGRERIR